MDALYSKYSPSDNHQHKRIGHLALEQFIAFLAKALAREPLNTCSNRFCLFVISFSLAILV